MYAGVPLYLSFFYPRTNVGFRQGIFLSGSALANAYGGALGYAILKIKSHLESWRILFLIEGLPTYVMVVVAFFFLPDNLSQANFLSDREKAIAVHCIKRGQIADTEQHAGLRWRELQSAFTDWRSMTHHVLHIRDYSDKYANRRLRLPTRHHVFFMQCFLCILASVRPHNHSRNWRFFEDPVEWIICSAISTLLLYDHCRMFHVRSSSPTRPICHFLCICCCRGIHSLGDYNSSGSSIYRHLSGNHDFRLHSTSYIMGIQHPQHRKQEDGGLGDICNLGAMWSSCRNESLPSERGPVLQERFFDIHGFLPLGRSYFSDFQLLAVAREQTT